MVSKIGGPVLIRRLTSLTLIILALGLAASLAASKSPPQQPPHKRTGRVIPRQTTPPISQRGALHPLDAIYNSADVPKPIRDFDTTRSTVAIEDTATVTDINVRIDTLLHTWIRDLRISLIAPNDSEAVLMDLFPADSMVNMFHCVFDDQAAESIFQAQPGFQGSFLPLQSLSRFVGLPSHGIWTLQIVDHFPGDTGSIRAWGLDINPTVNLSGTVSDDYFEMPVAGAIVSVIGTDRRGITNTDGYFAISSLDTGTYTVRFTGADFDTLSISGVVVPRDEPATLDATLHRRVVTYRSTARSVQIPDQSEASMIVNVPNPITITHMTVTVDITHTFAHDLRLVLHSPADSSVELIPNICDGNLPGENFRNCTFDDSARSRIAVATPPFTGTWIPSEPLSKFSGQQGRGNWTFVAIDSCANDSGKIDSVFLHFDLPIESTEPLTPPLPQRLALLANYPNPFNSSTTFRFDVSSPGRVELVIYNLLGEEAARVMNSVMDAGEHTVSFDGRNLASGVYIARLSLNGQFAQSRKILLLK
jgi:subtilisin-like proprotein convertase family protein